MRILLPAVLALFALYVLAVTGLFVLQRRILFLPDRTRPDLERSGLTGAREIAVDTEDGLSLLAWYNPPAHEDGLVLLHLHGNAGHIGHRAHRIRAFAPTGWGYLLLEYRGYGGNPGQVSETGLLTDARAALATLGRMGIPPERVLVWGESLGTNLATRLAAEAPVAALLLEAPYTSIAAIASSRYPYAPVNALLRDRFESIAWIGRVRAPVLVMHGAHDQIVPVAMGQAMYEAAPEPKDLWIAADGGHVDLIERGAVAAVWGIHSLKDRLQSRAVHLITFPGRRRIPSWQSRSFVVTFQLS